MPATREWEDVRPDFSGEYTLNRQASTLSAAAAAIRSGLVRIKHADPRFQLHATFAAADKTLEFSFERLADGCEVATGPGESASLRWDGDALVATDSTKTPDADLWMSWRYELQDGGRRLQAIEQLRGGGRDQDNVWVFARR